MVTQPPPGNEVMPLPTPAAEVSVVTSRGFSADAVTLAGLFKYSGGADSAIDPVRDARDHAGHLLADLRAHRRARSNRERVQERARLVQRDRARDSPGGNLSFSAREPPGGASERHLLRRRRLLSPRHANHHASCAHLVRPALDRFDPAIRTDSRWNGGKGRVGVDWRAGVAVRADEVRAGGAERQVPVRSALGVALVYQSVAEAGAHYVAFESSPTCPQSWRGCATDSDGDFNDAVYYVRETACPSTAERPRARVVVVAGRVPAGRAPAAAAVQRERRAHRVAREQVAPPERPAERAARRERETRRVPAAWQA